jgi:hypothetical protein
MILKAHVQGAAFYDVGDEIWQLSLADAINTEAETIASYAEADLLKSPDPGRRPWQPTLPFGRHRVRPASVSISYSLCTQFVMEGICDDRFALQRTAPA